MGGRTLACLFAASLCAAVPAVANARPDAGGGRPTPAAELLVEDRSGDAGAAPDIEWFGVHTRADGKIVAAMTFSNRLALRRGDLVAVSFDWDVAGAPAPEARLVGAAGRLNELRGLPACPARAGCGPLVRLRSIGGKRGKHQHSFVIDPEDLRWASGSDERTAWVWPTTERVGRAEGHDSVGRSRFIWFKASASAG
jgi:hypothetical protein